MLQGDDILMEATELKDEAPPPDPETVFLHREDPDWIEHVVQLLHEGESEKLAKFLVELFPSDIAHLIGALEFEDGQLLFERLDLEEQGAVLYELDEELRKRYFRSVLSPAAIAGIIVETPSDEAREILAELELERVSQILSQLPHNERVKVTELLSYPENSAGALMAKEFVAVQENDTVQKAISRLRRTSHDADDIYMIYVVDDEGRYKGHASLKNLILARPQSKVKRIMEEELLPIPALTDQEEVAKFFTRYDFIAAPVVDTRGVMLGRITVDDVLEVVQEEASEDILRMGGLSGEETLTTPILRSAARRAVWLIINLGTAFLAASVVRLFEQTLEKAITLAAFLPIVAGMGGNAAAQSMALVIRNIALGELTDQNAVRTLRREILIGLMNGASLGALTFFIVWFLTGSPPLATIILAALIINLLVASCSGALIPMILRAVRIDPALGSNIIVTTFTDTAGFFAVLGLAYVALQSGWL